MRGGLVILSTVNRRKDYLSVQEQVEKIKDRGLSIPSEKAVACFLERNNYYRFSGYMRYFQKDLAHGEDEFIAGATWDEIVDLYELDARLRSLLLDGIQLAEISTRTAFALSEGAKHGPYESFLRSTAYKLPKDPSVKPTHKLIASELQRSKEPYISKYRKDAAGRGPAWLRDVPVWVAVETFSLGTLSKAITYRNDAGAVYGETCSTLGVGKPFLASQLRSFTFVRNKCAHSSRLWNCFVLDQPKVPTSAKNRAERTLGEPYEPNSVMATIVALDNFLFRTGMRVGFLDEYLELAAGKPAFRRGISDPQNS